MTIQDITFNIVNSSDTYSKYVPADYVSAHAWDTIKDKAPFFYIGITKDGDAAATPIEITSDFNGLTSTVNANKLNEIDINGNRFSYADNKIKFDANGKSAMTITYGALGLRGKGSAIINFKDVNANNTISKTAQVETLDYIQSLFKDANKIYKITRDIDLNGGTLNLPSGCTLDFQGGSFSNGTLNGNHTSVMGVVKITATRSGGFNDYDTTANRPTNPTTGQMFFDTTLSKCIVYNGTAWVNVDGSALS